MDALGGDHFGLELFGGARLGRGGGDECFGDEADVAD